MENQNLPFSDSFGEDQDKGTNSDKLNPQFDDSLLSKPETFRNHIGEQLEKLEPTIHSHKNILNKLLDELKPIDFTSLVLPETQILKDELNAIKTAQNSGNNSLYNKLNKSKVEEGKSRITEIESTLSGFKKRIKQRNYVVTIISELLKIAKNNQWNLCKCYDYIYIYNGAYWKRLDSDDLKYFLGEAATKFGYPEIEAKHHLFKDELLKQFISQAHLSISEKDTDKILINLQNGTFEFKEGEWELRKFDPKDFLTYQLPFKYDPEAICPKFDNYLQEVLPDVNSRLILQEFCGYIFTSMNLETCLVLTGSGANGKSVFFKILTALLGKENTLTYSMGLFNHEYNRAKLTNVLVNYSSEKGTDLDVEIFKALITGEPVQAREPYGKSFTIHNQVKFIMNCNELPKKTESTYAFYRRFTIIPFEVTIPPEKRNIALADEIIKDELAGVFNWLLKGLKRLIEAKVFTESEKVKNALAEFEKQTDNIAQFIDEFGLERSEKKKSLASLFDQYKKFCNENEYKPLGKNKFSSKLEGKGFEDTRLNDGSKAYYIDARNVSI